MELDAALKQASDECGLDEWYRDLPPRVQAVADVLGALRGDFEQPRREGP